MTATERLRELLDERGVEWTANDGEYVKETCWTYMGELTAAFAEYNDGTTRFVCDTWCLTPSQAITATLGAGTIDKAAERIEVLSGFAREYLHRYGYLMNAAGEDVTDEVWAIEQVINKVCGAKVVDE